MHVAQLQQAFDGKQHGCRMLRRLQLGCFGGAQGVVKLALLLQGPAEQDMPFDARRSRRERMSGPLRGFAAAAAKQRLDMIQSCGV